MKTQRILDAIRKPTLLGEWADRLRFRFARRTSSLERAMSVARFAQVLKLRFAPELLVSVLWKRMLYPLSPNDYVATEKGLVFLNSCAEEDPKMFLFSAGTLADGFSRGVDACPEAADTPLLFCPGIGKPVFAIAEEGLLAVKNTLLIILSDADRVV